jgi:hypothetical protein
MPLTDIDWKVPAGSESLARQQAIEQVERKRRFRMHAAASAIGVIILVIIWALAEYHNAIPSPSPPGWPR